MLRRAVAESVAEQQKVVKWSEHVRDSLRCGRLLFPQQPVESRSVLVERGMAPVPASDMARTWSVFRERPRWRYRAVYPDLSGVLATWKTDDSLSSDFNLRTRSVS